MLIKVDYQLVNVSTCAGRYCRLLLLLKNVETTRQGYNVSLQNIKNAQSILSIVEAGQQKQLELLQSIKEKVVQIQDNFNQRNVRTSINSVTALKNEMDVGDQMSFNGTTIASGAGTASTFRVGSGTGSSDSFTVTTSTVITSATSVSIYFINQQCCLCRYNNCSNC